MTNINFLQAAQPGGVVSLLPILVFILIAVLVYQLTKNSVNKKISEFKQSMDKPTLNGQLMYEAGENLINLLLWGFFGALFSALLLVARVGGNLGGAVILSILAIYMLSKIMAIAFYLKGGKSE